MVSIMYIEQETNEKVSLGIDGVVLWIVRFQVYGNLAFDSGKCVKWLIKCSKKRKVRVYRN